MGVPMVEVVWLGKHAFGILIVATKKYGITVLLLLLLVGVTRYLS